MTLLPTIEDIREARIRIQGSAIRTPLVRLNVPDAPAEIYLKLENLQPIGSFKIRGASNAISHADKEQLDRGVYTASAGNMAQGIAWQAKRMGLRSTAVVPEHAPEAKLAALRRLGCEVLKVSFERWWQVMLTHQFEGMDGLFVHPVCNRHVMAGNGTIGLEILEDLPDAHTILIPYGGGGLSCGIAASIRALKPDTKIFACEVETAAPLSASLQANAAVAIDYTPSFVDGIGGKSVLAEMWPLASTLLDGALVMSLEQIKEAIKILVERNRVVAEGAGASSVAAALSGKAGGGKIVCVVSGGNINVKTLCEILQH